MAPLEAPETDIVPDNLDEDVYERVAIVSEEIDALRSDFPEATYFLAPRSGHIDDHANRACAMASAAQATILLMFGGVPLIVTESANPEDVSSAYLENVSSFLR